MSGSGYTLPVFAVSAAKAALLHLLEGNAPSTVTLDLLPESGDVAIEQVAKLDTNSALAVTRSDPGANLDITRNTPIWALARLGEFTGKSLILEGGEGVGQTETGKAAIYQYARKLFEKNLSPWIPEDKTLTVRVILPEGKQLAKRTSNEAFGILEGLSLLGTSGISQPHTALESLQAAQAELQAKSQTQPDLIFCLGSNGLQVCDRLQLTSENIVRVGNWIGALLVEAGLQKVRSVLLLGYHGKLVKLAGKIFNTSSHIADGKLEIIAATVAEVTDNIEDIRAVLSCETVAEVQKQLVKRKLADLVFQKLSDRISQNASQYVQKYADTQIEIGTVLFDRRGNIVAESAIAPQLMSRHR